MTRRDDIARIWWDQAPDWAVTATIRARDAIGVLRGHPVLTGWRIDCEPHAESAVSVIGDRVVVGPAVLTPLRHHARITSNQIDGHRMTGATLRTGGTIDRATTPTVGEQ